jgi:hypothetical protein
MCKIPTWIVLFTSPAQALVPIHIHLNITTQTAIAIIALGCNYTNRRSSDFIFDYFIANFTDHCYLFWPEYVEGKLNTSPSPAGASRAARPPVREGLASKNLYLAWAPEYRNNFFAGNKLAGPKVPPSQAFLNLPLAPLKSLASALHFDATNIKLSIIPHPPGRFKIGLFLKPSIADISVYGNWHSSLLKYFNTWSCTR